jgi:hypothetical protein
MGLTTWCGGGSCAGHYYVGGALERCCFSAAIGAVKAAHVTRGVATLLALTKRT